MYKYYSAIKNHALRPTPSTTRLPLLNPFKTEATMQYPGDQSMRLPLSVDMEGNQLGHSQLDLYSHLSKVYN